MAWLHVGAKSRRLNRELTRNCSRTSAKFALFTKGAHRKNEEITVSSDDEPSRTVLDRGFEEANKVMTEVVVGSSPHFIPTAAAGR